MCAKGHVLSLPPVSQLFVSEDEGELKDDYNGGFPNLDIMQ